jgi:hypothetical protein
MTSLIEQCRTILIKMLQLSRRMSTSAEERQAVELWMELIERAQLEPTTMEVDHDSSNQRRDTAAA